LKKNNKTRIAKLQEILATLRRGKNVQNRDLKTWLGHEAFAQIEDGKREQRELHEELKNKPDEIMEYEKRLLAATFTYSKADNASTKGWSTAKKMFDASDTKFERLLEYLQEQIVGNRELELWLDRDVHYDASNAPHSSPEDFPRVITSRSRNNLGGGRLALKRSNLDIKIAVVSGEIIQLTRDDVDDLALFVERQAHFRKLKKLANN